MLFNQVTKDHILQAIEDFEEKGYPDGFAPSSTYDIFYNHKIYPPKTIMAYANFHAEGRAIENYFKGGLDTDCFNVLKRNGFDVEKKSLIEYNCIKEAIIEAFAELDLKEESEINKSIGYDVVYKGKNYPPKEVYRLAFSFIEQNYPHISMPNLRGGKPTNKFIKKYGFEVVSKEKQDAIKKLISNYKTKIKQTHLKDERYKWELLNTFKERPDLESENLLEELKSVNYGNLMYAMSKAVIQHLLIDKPEETREIFKSLFNENIDLNKRVKSFNEDSLVLYREIGETLQHHQDERTISTYLTFKNPNKYTFYKYSFYKKYCDLLGVKQAKKNEKYTHYLELINQMITYYIEKDDELIDLVKKKYTRVL